MLWTRTGNENLPDKRTGSAINLENGAVWELSGRCLGALSGHSEGSQSALRWLLDKESCLGAVWELSRGGRVEELSGSCRRAALELSGSSRRLSEGTSGAV